MQKTAFKAGLFLCALIFLGAIQSQTVSASKISTNKLLASTNAFEYRVPALDTTQKPRPESKTAEKPAAPAAAPVPLQHTAIEGESLTMIAEKHASTWTRLYAKNTQIADPNVIKVGELITIPDPGEQLPDRPLPAPQPQATVVPVQPSGQNSAGYGANSAGNTYSAGYCTWYAKNRRPDLPNSLGNADTWVARAQAMGIATGSTPRAGAIGQQGMHVVYVESVNSDGTVTISEMNYQGLYVTSNRTVPAGNFMYIY